MISQSRRRSSGNTYKVHPDEIAEEESGDKIAENQEFVEEETVNAALSITKWFVVRL